MLNTMRHIGKSFVAKILTVLLVVSFGVWGVGDILRSHSASSLVTIDHEVIPAIEFATQRAQMRQAMVSLGVKNLDASAIDNEVLRQLVQQRLVRLWLKDAGLAVNHEMLAQAVKDNRQFKDVTGKFDKAAFEENLKNRRLTETAYLAQLRDEIAGKLVQSSLAMNDTAMPASLQKLAASVDSQTRDALLVAIPLGTVDAAAIPDKNLQDFYAARKADLYMDPERRTLEYVTLDKADIASMIDTSITEAMLKERYETEKTTDKTLPPTFDAARPRLLTLLRSEKRDTMLQDFSTTIEDSMAGGASMGEALAKAGVKSQSKLLTRMDAAQLAASADALLHSVGTQGFTLNQGETSGLQSTNDGRYFMVSVKEVVATTPKPFDAVKGDVRSHVAHEMATSQVYEKVAKVKEALLLPDAAARDKALAALGVSAHLVADLHRPVANAKGDTPLPAVLQQSVFEHRIGEVAGPLTAADGSASLALVTAAHAQPPASAEKSIAALQTAYKNELTEAAVGAMMNNLVNHYGVSVNQPLLQQLTTTAQ